MAQKTLLQILEKALEIRGNLIDSGETDFRGDSLETWDIFVNPKLRRTAGKCNYTHNRIELSFPLFSDEGNFLTELRNTVLHEFGHAITGPCITISGRRNPHGHAWKMTVDRIGGNSSRCHKMSTVKNKPRKRAEKRKGHCGRCLRSVEIGPTQYKRMVEENLVYRHRKCSGIIRLGEYSTPKKKLEGMS